MVRLPINHLPQTITASSLVCIECPSLWRSRNRMSGNLSEQLPLFMWVFSVYFRCRFEMAWRWTRPLLSLIRISSSRRWSMIYFLFFIWSSCLFMVRRHWLIGRGGSERVIVVGTSVVDDRFGCSKPPGSGQQKYLRLWLRGFGKTWLSNTTSYCNSLCSSGIFLPLFINSSRSLLIQIC